MTQELFQEPETKLQAKPTVNTSTIFVGFCGAKVVNISTTASALNQQLNLLWGMRKGGARRERYKLIS